MALTLTDRWIWDFWLVRAPRGGGADGSSATIHHLFFLQARNDLAHPDQRHWNVSIGHAVSSNLRDWTVLPDALHPGAPGAFDDASTWTGSVLPVDGRWVMLYTGTHLAEHGRVQRIGLAESTDLTTWHEHGAPVLETDPRWYETFDAGAWHDQAWRDPWLFIDPSDGRYHVLLTARAATGEPTGRGVIGHAVSSDLYRWEVLPPVTEPMGFGQMEVPQLVRHADRWYLLFCSDVETQDLQRREHGPGTGTYYLVGDSPTGPFHMIGDGALEADRRGSTYAGKLHETADGELVFLAWHRVRADGTFHGALSDPRPVDVAVDGTLSVR